MWGGLGGGGGVMAFRAYAGLGFKGCGGSGFKFRGLNYAS